MHGMSLSGQKRKHFRRFFRRPGLAEDPPLQLHHRVGGQNQDVPGVFFPRRFTLQDREASRGFGRGKTGRGRFVGAGRTDLEIPDADLLQKRFSSRRSRSKDQPHVICSS